MQLIKEVQISKNKCGYPMAVISCEHREFHYQSQTHSTHASVEIMCMKGSGQYEKVKIPHEFGEDNMVLFQKEKEELLAWVVPFDFFEFFDE